MCFEAGAYHCILSGISTFFQNILIIFPVCLLIILYFFFLMRAKAEAIKLSNSQATEEVPVTLDSQNTAVDVMVSCDNLK